MIAVIHAFVNLKFVKETKEKWNNDNGHSCIDITMVCTSNAYDSKRNKGNSHSYIHITVVCTSNAYGSK